MLLPGALLDTLLLLGALWLLPGLLPVVLVLLLLPLLGLLLVALVLLLLPVLGLLLVMLFLLFVPLLLSMLLLRFALLMSALLLRMILLLILVLSVSQSRDSEKQGQNGRAGNSNHFHTLLPALPRVRAAFTASFRFAR